ncbi:MAG: carboxypeptidase-like regulatory domain-containing protein, partial [Mangrovibacterium sp.]
MRLTNILQTCKFAGFCLACLFFAGTLQAQEAKPKVKSIDIALLVTDSLGKPVAGAAVVVGEGFIHKETAQDGKVTFNASATDFITITHAGYEKAVVVAGELPDNKTVVLTQAGLFL